MSQSHPRYVKCQKVTSKPIEEKKGHRLIESFYQNCTQIITYWIHFCEKGIKSSTVDATEINNHEGNISHLTRV